MWENLLSRAYAATAGDATNGVADTINKKLLGNTGVQTSIGVLITGASNIIAVVAGALAFIFLVYSGILYLTAGGNPDAAKKGQQGILNAVIGIVIIIAAWAIINAVVGTVTTNV